MADLDHLELLKQGHNVWNRWRSENADIRPDFVSANLCRGSLSGSDLSGADLTASNLRNAIMKGVNFEGAMLLYTNLSETDLRSAIFNCAKLIRADLRWADLKGAVFLSADLRGAKLDAADLSDADLSEAVGLTFGQLRKSVLNGNTRLPVYLGHEEGTKSRT